MRLLDWLLGSHWFGYQVIHASGEVVVDAYHDKASMGIRLMAELQGRPSPREVKTHKVRAHNYEDAKTFLLEDFA